MFHIIICACVGDFSGRINIEGDEWAKYRVKIIEIILMIRD